MADPGPVQDGTTVAESLVLAVHPYASPMEIVKQFTPLLEHLRERTGLPLSLSVSRDYETHVDRVGSGEVDFAFIGPASYVEVHRRYPGTTPLCSLEVGGSPFFRGYIVTREDSSADSLQDLADRSFAVSSRISTMSYILPRYMFVEAGVPFPERRLQIVKSHNNVCLNILAGDVFAGGIRDKAYLKYGDRGLKVVAVSPEIREHLFVASPEADGEAAATMAAEMIAIRDPERVAALLAPIKSTLTGLIPVSDEDYDFMRTVIRTVREDEQRSSRGASGAH